MTENRSESAIQEPSKDQQVASSLPEGGKIIWDDKEMQSSYANVVNVATTADEFMFLFGTNEAWNNAQKDVRVRLHERILMTPAAAKRLQLLLNKTMEEWEKKQGAKAI